MVRFSRIRRKDQSVREYFVEFDLPCPAAESQMEMGAGFPGQFVSILRTGNAALPRHEKSFVMPICRKSLRFEDASENTRRLFGSRGSGSRRIALFAEEAAESRADEGAQKKGGGRVEGGGQTLIRFYRKTG